MPMKTSSRRLIKSPLYSGRGASDACRRADTKQFAVLDSMVQKKTRELDEYAAAVCIMCASCVRSVCLKQGVSSCPRPTHIHAPQHLQPHTPR